MEAMISQRRTDKILIYAIARYLKTSYFIAYLTVEDRSASGNPLFTRLEKYAIGEDRNPHFPGKRKEIFDLISTGNPVSRIRKR